MSICLNTEVCTGCGLCVEGCPPRAIYLLAGKAVIEPELCTACGICVKVCAMGAITIVEPPTLIRPTQVQTSATALATRNTPRIEGKLVLWTGIAATLIEQQVLPRLMDAFIAALDRRLSHPRPLPARTAGKDDVEGNGGRGLMRRHRIRGDRSR